MSKLETWRSVAAVLSIPSTHASRYERNTSRSWWIALAVTSIIFLASFSFAVANLITAWHTANSSDWHDFWDMARMGTTFSPLVVLGARGYMDQFRRTASGILAAKQAAVDRDDTGAPLAQPQPTPATSEELNPGEIRIKWLKPVTVVSRGARIAAACALLFAVAILGLLSVVLWVAVSDQLLHGVAFALGSMAALVTILLIRSLYRARKSQHIVGLMVDDWCVQWRSGRRRQRILWQDALAFVTVRNRPGGKHANTEAYALEAADAVLTWEITNRSTTEERAAHERLSRLIVARTHLPLCDLTSAVEAALDPEKKEEQKPALTFPLPPPGSSPVQAVDLSITIVQRNDPAARAARRSARLSVALSAVVTVPVLVLYGAGWGLQQYQPQFYASLLAQVHAEKPLFQDNLAQDDSMWCVEEPSADNNYERYFYAGGAYHLVGKRTDWFMDCWSGAAYASDAAVEVTVSVGHASNDDGAGLEIHSRNNSGDFEMFDIDTHGYWSLMRRHYVDGTSDHDWTWIAGDYTSAAHQGAGARNRLLAIQRGSRFFLYVNDHFVGSYSDPAATRYGYMGVYVDMCTTEGIFSDFTVYPAPPTSLFSA